MKTSYKKTQRRILLTLDDEVLRLINKHAAEAGIPVATYARMLIQRQLRNGEKLGWKKRRKTS